MSCRYQIIVQKGLMLDCYFGKHQLLLLIFSFLLLFVAAFKVLMLLCCKYFFGFSSIDIKFLVRASCSQKQRNSFLTFLELLFQWLILILNNCDFLFDLLMIKLLFDVCVLLVLNNTSILLLLKGGPTILSCFRLFSCKLYRLLLTFSIDRIFFINFNCLLTLTLLIVLYFLKVCSLKLRVFRIVQ